MTHSLGFDSARPSDLRKDLTASSVISNGLDNQGLVGHGISELMRMRGRSFDRGRGKLQLEVHTDSRFWTRS